jgi:hypothetical protein
VQIAICEHCDQHRDYAKRHRPDWIDHPGILRFNLPRPHRRENNDERDKSDNGNGKRWHEVLDVDFCSLDINGIDWRAIANYDLDYLRTLSPGGCAGAR